MFKIDRDKSKKIIKCLAFAGILALSTPISIQAKESNDNEITETEENNYIFPLIIGTNIVLGISLGIILASWVEDENAKMDSKKYVKF